ncbi:mucin-like protein, partial [Achlya hypogyna]
GPDNGTTDGAACDADVISFDGATGNTNNASADRYTWDTDSPSANDGCANTTTWIYDDSNDTGAYDRYLPVNPTTPVLTTEPVSPTTAPTPTTPTVTTEPVTPTSPPTPSTPVVPTTAPVIPTTPAPTADPVTPTTAPTPITPIPTATSPLPTTDPVTPSTPAPSATTSPTPSTPTPTSTLELPPTTFAPMPNTTTEAPLPTTTSNPLRTRTPSPVSPVSTDPPTPPTDPPTPPTNPPMPPTPSPVPTELPLIPPSTTVATVSPILDTLLIATVPTATTPTPSIVFDTSALLSQVTPSPVPVVVTISPAAIDQLNQLGSLGATGAPTTAPHDVVPENDHSDVLNRARLDATDADTLAALTAGTAIGVDVTPALRPAVAALLGIALLLLGFFHVQAIHPESVAPDAYAEALWRPNAWELPLVLSTLQQLAALAFAKNNNRPQRVYIAFLDTLSWSLFCVRGSDPAPTAPVSAIALAPRRLESYDATGFVQFALRSGIDESDWFVRVLATVLGLVAIVLVVVVATGVWAYVASRTAATGYDSNSATAYSRYVQLRTLSHQCLGLLVVLGLAAVLPLVYMAVVELLQDGTGVFGKANGVLALATLLLLCVLLGILLRWLHRQSRIALAKWRVRIVFGVLYANAQYDRRCIVGLFCALQALTAVIVAVVTVDGVSQMLALVVLHGAYVLALLNLRPFTSRVHLHATLLAELLVVAVLGLAAGLNARLTIDTQVALSYAVVALVTAAVVCVFLRQLAVLAKYAGLGTRREAHTTSSALVDMGHAPLTTSRGVRPAAAML